MPEGPSTWDGTAEVNDTVFQVVADIINTQGDLTAEATITSDLLGTASYSLTGTHDPRTGDFAFAPEAWIEAPPIEIEVVGMRGTFDPETNTLSGLMSDYAGMQDNALTGGPVELALVSGDGEPTQIGDEANALPSPASFTGTYICSGPEREVELKLAASEAGAYTGELTFGDLTIADGYGTFEVTAVHNPTTGGLTLVPGLYTASETEENFVAFFVDGTFNATNGSLNGEGRTNVGPCPSAAWNVAL